jgi:hypothetical protein
VGYILLLLTTVLFYHFSEIHHGVAAQDQKYYYTWKYGPTAVVILVGSLWHRVDYMIKLSTPWAELEKGQKATHSALQLDYITPLLPEAMWKALKNRHCAVALSCLSQILLIIATVFSSNLFHLTPEKLMEQRNDLMQESQIQLMEGVSNNSTWFPGSSVLCHPNPRPLISGWNFGRLRRTRCQRSSRLPRELQLHLPVRDNRI